MAVQKTSIPKGMRDFSPREVVQRKYIFAVIESVFRKYGYLPLETPAMETLETLTGKYGEEGDRLIFKILNSGDFLAKVDENKFHEKNSKFMIPEITEKALRYDLTIPFARYVVMHRNEITLPFKRYQIQPVWRADRPQKGRYREFYQCDVDVIGSDSLLNEAEFVLIYDEALTTLGLTDFTIKLNNRKILSGIAEVTGVPEKLTDITVAMDKLDKIGEEGVVSELSERGILPEVIEELKPLIHFRGDTAEKLQFLKNLLRSSETGVKGITEIETIFDYVKAMDSTKAKLEIDITLARGLNYYTGAIFEVKANSVPIGSIGGGGRYDNLTGIFGLPGISGVGVSFGADRIYDVLEELKLFPAFTDVSTKVLFINFGFEEEKYCLPLLSKLRKQGINAEIYPEAAKLKKQMAYADSKKIPFVVLSGSEEIKNNLLILKNMNSGEQENVVPEELAERLA